MSTAAGPALPAGPVLPVRAVLLELTVLFVGVLVAAGATSRLLGLTPAGPSPAVAASAWWAMLAAVPVTAWLCTRSLKLTPVGGAVHIALDSTVLVFLAWTTAPAAALLAWLAGVAVSQAIAGHRLVRVRFFNVGLSAVAGEALLAVTQLLRAQPHGFGPRDLLAVTAGTVVYLACDVLLTGVSVAWTEGIPIRETIRDASAPVGGFGVLAVNGLGLLAALLYGQRPWTLLLLVPALSVIVYAARVSALATTARAHTQTLLDAATACQRVSDREQLGAAITSAAAQLTASPSARLGPEAATASDLAVPVRSGPESMWLVATARRAGHAFEPADRAGLQVLAALAGQALDRVDTLEAMRRHASLDPLTGIANRRSLDEAMTASLATADAERRTPGLIYLDLDRFKAVNDTYGHAAGDQLLVVVARRLSAALRGPDLLGRLGGDEFVIFVLDTSRPQADALSERLRVALRAPVAITVPDGSTVTLDIAASVGVALYQPGQTGQQLLATADAMMYAAKRRGVPRAEKVESSAASGTA